MSQYCMSAVALVLLSIGAASSVRAQPVDEAAALKDELQKCSALKKIDLKAKCFETASFAALATIVRLTAKPSIPPKTKDDLAREQAEAAAQVISDQRQEFVSNSLEILTRDFKDPKSAVYRDLFVGVGDEKSKDNTKLHSLCGEVNAKNSYGAYVGFRRFYVSANGASAVAQVEKKGSENIYFDKTRWSLCQVRVYDVDP